MIDSSVIEEILKEDPDRLALFKDPSAKAGKKDTDKIIVAIRDLYIERSRHQPGLRIGKH